jgi:nicotinate-nucleotide adenylyltransferase
VSDEILVFGGTFDPVHVGHTSIAEQVLEATGADQLWFMPAGRPALRDDPVASALDRLAMLQAAVRGLPRQHVRDDELRREGRTYTVDTLRALRRRYPDARFSLLVGADAARSISRWEGVAELQHDGDFVIVNRTGVDELGEDEVNALGFAPERRRLLSVASPRVSATDVRRRATAGESLAGLVHPDVARLIADRGLYASDARPRHNALG